MMHHEEKIFLEFVTVTNFFEENFHKIEKAEKDVHLWRRKSQRFEAMSQYVMRSGLA